MTSFLLLCHASSILPLLFGTERLWKILSRKTGLWVRHDSEALTQLSFFQVCLEVLKDLEVALSTVDDILCTSLHCTRCSIHHL